MITHDDAADCRAWCDLLGFIPPGWHIPIIDHCMEVEHRLRNYSPSELESWKGMQALLLKDGQALTLDPAARQRVEDKLALAESLPFGILLSQSPAFSSAVLWNYISAHSSNFNRK